MPAPESRGTDLLRVMHHLYLEFIAAARKDFGVKVDHLGYHGIQHAKMRDCADMLTRVMRQLGKTPWSIIAHTDECDAPPPGFSKQGDGAHICGFWAVRLSEQKESTSAVKLPFGFLDTQPDWLWDIANQMIDLFADSGSCFYWEVEAIAAKKMALRAERGVSR